MTFSQAINRDNYTYQFVSSHTSRRQAVIAFNYMRRFTDELCEDSKYRIIEQRIDGLSVYGLYVWY